MLPLPRAPRLRMRLLLFASLLVLAACDSGPGGSLYDPDAQDGPAPVITAVSPEGVVLAGIDEIVVTGQNFSETAGDNLVFFDDGAGNAAQGEVIAATPTELRVKVPNLPNPALRLRVSVRGAGDFSNAVDLPLTPAFVPFGDLDPSPGVLEGPAAIVGDGTGAVYVSVSRGGNAGGIVRISPEGVSEPFASSRILWGDLALGPDVPLYGTQAVQAIFKLPSEQPALPILGNSVRITAITPDGAGGIWAGGAAGTPTAPATPYLYRFDLAGNATQTAFPGTVSDLRTFDGYLYVSGTRSGAAPEAKVWRLPILSDGTLGPEEVVYDVSADQPGLRPSALAIAADGTVFVGIAPPVASPRDPVEFPVIRVAPDGTAAPLYPGVLPSPVSALTWGEGSSLYLVQSRVPPPSGATGYGTPATIFKVETRQQGSL